MSMALGACPPAGYLGSGQLKKQMAQGLAFPSSKVNKEMHAQRTSAEPWRTNLRRALRRDALILYSISKIPIHQAIRFHSFLIEMTFWWAPRG